MLAWQSAWVFTMAKLQVNQLYQWTSWDPLKSIFLPGSLHTLTGCTFKNDHPRSQTWGTWADGSWTSVRTFPWTCHLQMPWTNTCPAQHQDSLSWIPRIRTGIPVLPPRPPRHQMPLPSRRTCSGDTVSFTVKRYLLLWYTNLLRYTNLFRYTCQTLRKFRHINHLGCHDAQLFSLMMHFWYTNMSLDTLIWHPWSSDTSIASDMSQ